ncbi:MAG TPA: TolC family protein, partial [Acidobacteriaceae bacterium]
MAAVMRMPPRWCGLPARRGARLAWLLAQAVAWSGVAIAQAGAPTSSVTTLPTPLQVGQQQVAADSYQGSVSDGRLVPGVLPLSLDEAIRRGLQFNLGLILSSQNQLSARATQLGQLQSLLPTIDGRIQQTEQETDLQAQGLRIPGFPAIIGPYAYQDFRATLDWRFLSIAALRNYVASRHNLRSAQLTAEDARDQVVLSVGNAYLLVLADQGRIVSAQAQV